ncbi:hypothetical protein GCM10007863_03980 [Dyella mobilis]|nr:hypothetical protein GCM10007863_03980 [Dyella mobilis]
MPRSGKGEGEQQGGVQGGYAEVGGHENRIGKGERESERWLARLSACLEPGSGGDSIPLAAPHWLFGKCESFLLSHAITKL